MKKELNIIIPLILLMALCAIVGSAIGIRYIKDQAVTNGNAFYDSQTREFKWRNVEQ